MDFSTQLTELQVDRNRNSETTLGIDNLTFHLFDCVQEYTAEMCSYDVCTDMIYNAEIYDEVKLH